MVGNYEFPGVRSSKWPLSKLDSTASKASAEVNANAKGKCRKQRKKNLFLGIGKE